MPEIINDGQWFLGLDSSSYSLGQGLYQWSQNISNRGGMIQTRQGFAEIIRGAVNQKARGIGLFPTGETRTIVVAIGSKVYKLEYPYTGNLVEISSIINFPTTDTKRMVHFEVGVQAQFTLPNGELRLIDPPRFVMIMQDGVTTPYWWTGDAVGQFRPDNPDERGIIVADYMKWAGDRLWLVKDNKVYASDLLNPAQMTETTITASGGFFVLPEHGTGMGVTHDYKTLLVFTDQTTSAFQVGLLDRTMWPSTQDFQRVVFPNIGCISHRSIVNMYGMTWWMGHDGIIGLDNALQTNQTSRIQTRDQNMSRSREGISWEDGGGCSGTYGNFLFFSVPSGSRYNVHTWVMDQGVVDTINQISPPAWSSNWTGIRPEQWAIGDSNGHQRCFCITNDLVPEGTQPIIWEAFIGQRMDVPKVPNGGGGNGGNGNGNGEPKGPIEPPPTEPPPTGTAPGSPVARDIACAFETKFFGLSPTQYCRFRWAELDLAEISGRVNLQVYYCGRRTSYKKILDKQLNAVVSGDVDQEFIPDSRIGVFVPQYRTVRSVTDSSETDDQNSGVQTPYIRQKDREFSLLVTWTGKMAITGLRICVDPEGDYVEGLCEEHEIDARGIDSDGTGVITPGQVVTNEPSAAVTSQYLAPITPRWIEFPSYDAAVPNDVFFVANPEFSPVAGGYGSGEYPLDVTISTETQGCNIKWTIDGSIPSRTHGTEIVGSSGVASVPLTSPPTTLQAMAFRNGLTDSHVTSGTYTTGTVSNCTFSPIAGSYPSTDFPKPIHISTVTPSATIKYIKATSGEPNTLYNDSIPPTVIAGQTIRARASKTGWDSSAITSAAYAALPPAATPTFNPAGGAYASFPQNIAITSTTAGATIRYTINNTNVSGSTTTVPNNGHVSVSTGNILRARAEHSGFSASAVATATYTGISGTVAIPTMVPNGFSGPNHNPSVVFHCATAGATISATVAPQADPPDIPTRTNGHLCHDGDNIRTVFPNWEIGHKVVKLMAFKDGMNDSGVRSANFDYHT